MPWHHPDELDRIAASPDRPGAPVPASAAEVAEVLGKALVTGGLRRIPRNPRHRNVVLALLCLELRRRYPYSEPEVNDALVTALAGFEADVDHVTCRRYLIELGFLKRDRAGRRYLLNYGRVEAVLSPDAVGGATALVRHALERSRSRRKPERDTGMESR